MSGLIARPRRPPSPDDAVFAARRRLRRATREFATRAGVAVLFFAYNEALHIASPEAPAAPLRLALALGFFLNGPYYLAARTGIAPEAQAYVRMLGDVLLVTLGLYGTGGVAAAPYLVLYTLVPVYAGIVMSATACVVATLFATGSFLAVGLLQELHWLPVPPAPIANPWSLVGFNLLILNLVGALTAVLTEAYRQSQRRLQTLYQELERAHDAALDLTEELQRRARLHVLGEVSAGIAHEMRNALSVAAGQLDVALSKPDAQVPTLLRHLQRSREGCEAAIRVLGSTLAIARQSAEEKQRVLLADIARQVIDLKRYDLRREGITIELAFAEAYPPVVAVPFQLQQVLLNLVANAQEALRETQGTRSITIVGRADATHAVLEIRDSGPGIPADVLPHLFERFFTTKRNGTGLGLAIAAGIIRQNDGELTAENAPEGAVFRIRIPRGDLEPAGGDVVIHEAPLAVPRV